MLSEAEFDFIDQQRHALINKMFSGFTEEENYRRYEDHTGWKEESDRRNSENLSEDEKLQLEVLTRQVEWYLDELFPLTVSQYLEEWLEQKR